MGKMFDEAKYLVEVESLSKLRNKKKNKKRRFSDEQIRSLEVMFESDTKLEARKKAEVARELGLQPRQIAIWFQNRRARWKSKQIEKDYSLLLSNYNALASQFESLKKDNHFLLSQLQKLKKRGGDVAEGGGVVAAADEENGLRKMFAVETGSSEDWEGLDSDELITQPSQGYQWWDFWG